jgi:hypothetical protein
VPALLVGVASIQRQLKPESEVCHNRERAAEHDIVARTY